MSSEEQKRLEQIELFLGTMTVECIEENCDLTALLMHKEVSSYEFLLECPVSPKFIKSMISYGKKKRLMSLAVRNILLSIRAALLMVKDEEGNLSSFDEYSISILSIFGGSVNRCNIARLVAALKRNGIFTMSELLNVPKATITKLAFIDTYYENVLIACLNNMSVTFSEVKEYITQS